MNEWEEFCRADLESMVTPEILERGSRYFEDGHVLAKYRVGPVLAGLIAGMVGNYKARLWLEDGVVQAECNCPFQGFCKHLTALALAWFESPQRFKDIEPDLNRIIENPDMVVKTLVRLCHGDPIGFSNLTGSSQNCAFDSARGILNLVRNTFNRPQIRPQDAVALWENVTRILDLLGKGLRQGHPDGLLPLEELVRGISEAYLESPCELLTESFKELTTLIADLPAFFSAADLRPLFILLWDLYFEPQLWEWNEMNRHAICSLGRSQPALIANFIEQRRTQEGTTLELVLILELLRRLNVYGGCFGERADEVEQELVDRLDGRLWLIDRYGEEEPGRALRLAREGLRLVKGEGRNALRERMIQLHARQSDFKQAASLSFIQFCEGPSFEEYLRLKDLLERHPQEWDQYYWRIVGFLKETARGKADCHGLLLRIYYDARDYLEFGEYIAEHPVTPNVMFEIVDSWNDEVPWELAFMLPQLIEALLTVNSAGSWQKALKLIVTYKKTCRSGEHYEEWNDFRSLLNDKFRDQRSFNRRFGAILSEL